MKQCRCYGMMFVLLLLCSCAYARQANIREEFDKSMKGYNKMLRWRDIENAGMTYIDPELRDAFMKSAEQIRRRGVTITGLSHPDLRVQAGAENRRSRGGVRLLCAPLQPHQDPHLSPEVELSGYGGKERLAIGIRSASLRLARNARLVRTDHCLLPLP